MHLKYGVGGRCSIFRGWHTRQMLLYSNRTNKILSGPSGGTEISYICLTQTQKFFGHTTGDDNLEGLMILGNVQGHTVHGRSLIRWYN